MAKVQIGRLEVEVPEATLWDAERLTETERLFDGKSLDPYIAAILLLTQEANPGLDAEKIKRALPFFGVAGRLIGAYRDVLAAAGIIAPGGEPGEAPRP